MASRLPDIGPAGPAVRLSGGLINEVWRVEARASSVVVKHAPPHAASAPSVPLSPLRATFEARALRLVDDLPALKALRDHIRAPRLLDFDPHEATLIIEDLGTLPHLEQELLAGTGSEKTARWLGLFIGALHVATMRREGSALAERIASSMNNRDIQESRLRVQYASAAGLLAAFDIPDADRLGADVARLGERLLEPGICLTMGDLWPRSILGDTDAVYVIDWEFAHFGRPLQDIAHFAAHLRLLGQRGDEHAARNTRRTWSTFGDAYRSALGAHFETLWTAAEVAAAVRHQAAEILVRQAGPFASRSTDAGDEPQRASEAVTHAAVAYAAHLLREADRVDLFAADHWPLSLR